MGHVLSGHLAFPWSGITLGAFRPRKGAAPEVNAMFNELTDELFDLSDSDQRYRKAHLAHWWPWFPFCCACCSCNVYS
jgi:hypothetical protein